MCSHHKPSMLYSRCQGGPGLLACCQPGPGPVRCFSFHASNTCRPSARLPGWSAHSYWRRGNAFHAFQQHHNTRQTLLIRPEAVFSSFTERAISSTLLAQQEAAALEAPSVDIEHVLLGLLAEAGKGDQEPYLGLSGVRLEQARKVVREVTKHRRVKVSDRPFSQGAKDVFEAALEVSRRRRTQYVLPEHIMIALMSVRQPVIRLVVQRLGTSTAALTRTTERKLKGEQEESGEDQRALVGAPASRGAWGGKIRGGPALEAFCIDLCELAGKRRLDPVIGRDKEVTRVMQILARRSKNNPLLLGEPGVGKTAIAEGLANAIVSGLGPHGGPLPSFLAGKRVLQLDVGLLISGAKERGELEARITSLLSEIATEGNIILMIDEVHTLVGSGAAARGRSTEGGGLDLANLLKPALARGKLQCIGATTLDEHRKHILRDAALERRFQPVRLDEPSPSQTLAILQGLQDGLEAHHQCVYAPAALSAAVTLSGRYVADRFMPDKAIDVLDEAGSRARIAAFNARRAMDLPSASHVEHLSELQEVMAAKGEAIKEGRYEEAELLRSRELEMKARVATPASEGGPLPLVTEQEVAEIVASWTGIPVQRLSASSRLRLLHLADSLKERVIGQEEAADAVARALRRSGAGIGDPERPIASMLFSGPTGVGKTETARAVADLYFGSRSDIIRFDMSEYMERHTVAKLIGAPPGYIGHGEAGELTEAVRRRPHCLVLLDEIEKAHPDVFNLLLQILEDGRLTDAQGRTVSFKNALIVMTSNVGSSHVGGGAATVGFALPSSGMLAEENAHSAVREKVLEELKAYFRPELLNRLDKVIVFRALGRKALQGIVNLLLEQTAARLQPRGIRLRLSMQLTAHLMQQGYEPAYGARPLRRAISRLVEDPLAAAILAGQLQEGDTAELGLDADGEVCVTASRPGTIVYKSEIVESAGLAKAKVKGSVNVGA